jgi:23S rRNA (uracil1939-C5)-methyltransferase
VFVEGALGGEVVTAVLLHETSSMADAQVVSVLKKSDMRQKPPCRQASQCGGCQLQHVTPSSQLALKKQWLVQTLRRIGQWPAEQISAAGRLLRCEQGLTSRYRQRVRWHFNGEHLGFFARRSHQVVSAEGCIIAAAPLEQARAQLLARLRSAELSEAFNTAGLIDMQIEATLLKNETVSLWLKDVRCSAGNVAEAKIRELMHNFIRTWNGPQIDERGFVQVHHPEIENFSLAPPRFYSTPPTCS